MAMMAIARPSVSARELKQCDNLRASALGAEVRYSSHPLNPSLSNTNSPLNSGISV